MTRYLFIGLIAFSSAYSQDNSTAIAMQDADGNIYHSVKIGKQEWLIENLMATKFNDGTEIPLVTAESNWNERTLPACCWFNDDSSYKNNYGALYNWQAVNTGKLAPKGWHVPSDAEWSELERYLTANNYNWDGSKEGDKTAKSLAAKTDWNKSPTIGTIGYEISKNNSSGFSALPGGFRNRSGVFYSLTFYGYFWTATKSDDHYAWFRYFQFNLDHPYRNISLEGCGFSVRLLRD